MKILASVSLLACFTASAAFAYIPPAQFIIQNMAAKRKGIRSVKIVSQVTGYQSGKPTDHHFKVVSIFDPQTQSLRSQAFNATGAVVFGLEKNQDEVPLVMRILYDPSSREVIAALKHSDIPINTEETGTEQSALRRWNGTLAWVLGVVNGKATPQLWVEKDTFTPLRLMTGEQDVEFNKFRYAQALAYPRTIATLDRSGVELFQEEIQEVRVNPALSPEEVSIAKGFSDQGNASPERDLIQKYYDGLR